MNVFQLIKTVLDEIYSRIPKDSEQEKDAAIRQAILALRDKYPHLATGVEIEYSDIITRFAYIYAYVTCHANLVYQAIREHSPELAALFNNEKVNVTCIGGGPGSEILGILKYISRENKNPFVRCTLFDKEPGWAECWNDVDEKLTAQVQISTFYQAFDVTKAETWSIYDKYLKADLFSMIYFMSEVNSLRDSADAFFSNFFEKAKQGALFLYIDNNNAQFYEWFDSLVKRHSLSVLRSKEFFTQITDYDEEKRDLGEFWDKFGNPRLNANIAFRVCRKD